ncbi:hypothetical protein NLI96_g11186 [Meripilus lineatus]|uniref:Uncharacterized protein n=1 Tax=Meripilus lineatus TaxID=2056292 RepID=A0AAD5UX60_9APHY|nr:hypothetical protein NLI96_g11186 [Physisporinus lineatus]
MAESGAAVGPSPRSPGEGEKGGPVTVPPEKLFDKNVEVEEEEEEEEEEEVEEEDSFDQIVDDAMEDLPPKVLRTNKFTKELVLPDKMFRLPEQTDQMISNRNYQVMLPIASKKSIKGRTLHQYKGLIHIVTHAEQNEIAQLRAKRVITRILEMSRIENLWRDNAVKTHADEVAQNGSSDAAYSEEGMLSAIKQQVHGDKKPIHRRPAAGSSRESEKQRSGQAVAHHPSLFLRLDQNFTKVPCHSGTCNRQKFCSPHDIVCRRECIGPNPTGKKLADAETHYKYTHWECLTHGALAVLKENPSRYTFDGTLNTQIKRKLQAVISGKRKRPQDEEPTKEEIEKRVLVAIALKAKTRQKRANDYSVAFKDKRGARHAAKKARIDDLKSGLQGDEDDSGNKDDEENGAHKDDEGNGGHKDDEELMTAQR